MAFLPARPPVGLQHRPAPLAVQPRRLRPRISTQVFAAADPWETLGLDARASEEEIKKAHRKLVLKHHPDLRQGDVTAHARFLSIQEAYELVIGKRRGKEVDSRPSAGGWDFHDWFWSFSMRRRRNAAGGATTTAPPPPEAVRQQWRQQLGGLRQKAAANRFRARQRQPFAQNAGSAPPAPSPTGRRSAAVAAQSRAQQRTVSQAQADALHHSTPPAARSAPASTAGQAPGDQEPLGATQHVAAANTEQLQPSPAGTAEGQEGSTPSEQVQHLLHAVHMLRHRHEHAAHARAQRVSSHIASLGEKFRERLHGRGLLELLNLTDLQPVGSPSHAHTASGHVQGPLRVQFSGMHSMHTKAGNETAQWQPTHAGDPHSSKFADREHVEGRLTGQLAGMKRRAALKKDFVE